MPPRQVRRREGCVLMGLRAGRWPLDLAHLSRELDPLSLHIFISGNFKYVWRERRECPEALRTRPPPVPAVLGSSLPLSLCPAGALPTLPSLYHLSVISVYHLYTCIK